MAARQWRDMGARTQEEARSFIVSSLRRRLGLVICREFARHPSAACHTSACRGPSLSSACSAASSSGGRRHECRSIPNAGGLCIAAGSSGLARAQAMLTGEMYRTHALSGTTERRAWRDARTSLRPLRSLCKVASFVKNRKELITDHLTNVQSGRPVRARSHCAGSTHTAGGRAEPPWLQCKSADRACACCVGAGRRARAPT